MKQQQHWPFAQRGSDIRHSKTMNPADFDDSDFSLSSTVRFTSVESLNYEVDCWERWLRSYLLFIMVLFSKC